MQRSTSREHTFGRYRIDSEERVLRLGGRTVALAPKVVDTLLVLLERGDRIVSKAELMDRVWPGIFVDEANLTQNVYVLRKLFAEHASDVHIENVPKRGYRLAVPPPEPLPVVEPLAARVRRTQTASRRFVPVLFAGALLLGTGGPLNVPPPVPAQNVYALPANDVQHYMLGRYYLNRGTPNDLQRSLAQFRALLADCPRSALAYAGLADGITSLTFVTDDPGVRARLGARAMTLANEAVGFEPNSADAQASLGAVQASIAHDAPAASRSFETSLRIDPRNFDALVWYGTELMNDGSILRARRLFQRAMAVNPDSPGALASLAWADFLARDFRAAAALSEQLLRAHRLESIARITLASSYVELRDYDRALPVIAALRRHDDTRTQGAALLSQIYALRGNSQLAVRELSRLEARADPDRLGPWDVLALAAAYARAGRTDAAFVWLTRIRWSERGQLAGDPRFDRLRKDRRFEDWVRG